jgi:hypothetical protein
MRHRAEGVAGWGNRVRFVRDADDRGTLTLFDLHRDGRVRRIDPSRPIVLWKNPLNGTEVVLPLEACVRAIAAFDRLPRDDRTAAEAAANRDRVRVAVGRYVGHWRLEPNRGWPAMVEVRDGRPFFAFYPPKEPDWYSLIGFKWLRVAPDGRLH